MFHEKTGWAKCGHEIIYLTKDNASFEPEMCSACRRVYFAERKRMFAAGDHEPTIPEDEKMVMAECGHLGESVMVDGRWAEPKECLDCFTARHERNAPVAWEAVAILGHLMHEVFDDDQSDE